MNFRTKMIVAISLLFASQIVAAGTITDTYTAGDTLTVSTLDNIKAAVNGNAIKPVARCSDSLFSFSLTTTNTTITSVDITVGGAGTVMVTGSTSLSVTSTGGQWEGDVYVSATTDTVSNFRRQWWVPAGMPTGSTASPVQVQGAFTVPSAGTYTYYLTGNHFFTTVVNANKSTICAVFTPD